MLVSLSLSTFLLVQRIDATTERCIQKNSDDDDDVEDEEDAVDGLDDDNK